MLRFLIIFVSVFLTVINLKAQDFEINTKPETFKKLNISGEYRGFFQQRNCYRVMERPSVDETHFNYVHNHHAKSEMQKLYALIESSLWGDEI